LPRGIRVIPVVRLKPVADEPIEHLSIEAVRSLLKKARPRLTLLTHFGMTMIKATWVVAAELGKELGLKVIAANDGMKIDLEEV
jgi:ribonuclease BN (tRNA processing enzyme)